MRTRYLPKRLCRHIIRMGCILAVGLGMFFGTVSSVITCGRRHVDSGRPRQFAVADFGSRNGSIGGSKSLQRRQLSRQSRSGTKCQAFESPIITEVAKVPLKMRSTSTLLLAVCLSLLAAFASADDELHFRHHLVDLTAAAERSSSRRLRPDCGTADLDHSGHLSFVVGEKPAGPERTLVRISKRRQMGAARCRHRLSIRCRPRGDRRRWRQGVGSIWCATAYGFAIRAARKTKVSGSGFEFAKNPPAEARHRGCRYRRRRPASIS